MSTEELFRVTPNRRKFISNRWPLIEARMDRAACVRWCEDRQIPRPPKSACIFCPYVSNEVRRERRDSSPEDHARSIAFDEAIRRVVPVGEAFVHRDMRPLAEVDLDKPGNDLFDHECEGMCGV